MRKVSIISTIIIFGIMLMPVRVSAQQSSRDFETQIEQLDRDLANYMIQGNTEKTLDMYTQDAISLPSYEPLRQGIDQIRQGIEEMSSSGAKITSFEPKILKVIPEGNLITEIGTYRISMTMPNSSESMQDHGKYLTIWEKQPDGSLKIKVETWNSDSNPMGQEKGQGQSNQQQ